MEASKQPVKANQSQLMWNPHNTNLCGTPAAKMEDASNKKPKNLCFGCRGQGHYATECPTVQKKCQQLTEPNSQQNIAPQQEWTPCQLTPVPGYTPQPNQGNTPGPNRNQHQSTLQVTYQEHPIKLKVNMTEGVERHTSRTKKTSSCSASAAKETDHHTSKASIQLQHCRAPSARAHLEMPEVVKSSEDSDWDQDLPLVQLPLVYNSIIVNTLINPGCTSFLIAPEAVDAI